MADNLENQGVLHFFDRSAGPVVDEGGEAVAAGSAADHSDVVDFSVAGG